jgi:hypothetical protein
MAPIAKATGLHHIDPQGLSPGIVRESCEWAECVNLEVDGGSDPRGRRYQGVNIRFVDGIGATPAALLAVKEAKSGHECAAELSAMVRYFQGQFRIAEKTLNSCSDRCNMNVRAFRRDMRELSTGFGDLWFPCVCHILNNVISFFMSRITRTRRPIFGIQQRFRKCGPFLAYLRIRAAPRQTIPSMSTMRWDSSEDRLATMLTLWPYMVEFARKKRWDMPELNEKVWADLRQLQRPAAAFVMAQKELESDEFGLGSLFISHFLRLERRLRDFRECEPKVHHSTIEYIVQLRRDYEWEYDIYILMAFLNPSVQFRVGRTCSEEAYEIL